MTFDSSLHYENVQYSSSKSPQKIVNINSNKIHYFKINSNFQGSISHVHLVQINVLETKTEIKTFD